jgi:hypothetical protein
MRLAICAAWYKSLCYAFSHAPSRTRSLNYQNIGYRTSKLNGLNSISSHEQKRRQVRTYRRKREIGSPALKHPVASRGAGSCAVIPVRGTLTPAESPKPQADPVNGIAAKPTWDPKQASQSRAGDKKSRGPGPRTVSLALTIVSAVSMEQGTNQGH